jgi:hypothetical protein
MPNQAVLREGVDGGGKIRGEVLAVGGLWVPDIPAVGSDRRHPRLGIDDSNCGVTEEREDRCL